MWPTIRLAFAWVKGVTKEVNSSTNERQLTVEFKWDSTSLGNLVIDENEAIEAEVLFYNYGSGTGIPSGGKAYMYYDPISWSTNLPSGYLDTRFMDSDNEKSYSVGSAQPQKIVAGSVYRFTMNAKPKDPVNQGLWQINFQRGYWFDSQNSLYRLYRGTGDEWYVFNEEYETTAKVKQYHKYNSTQYAPSTFDEYTASGYLNQFRYKESFQAVSSGSNIDTGSIPTGGYKVYKLTVDADKTYTIKTSKYGSTSSDTYLRLYNQNFTQIAYNDDSNQTLYSEIQKYLSKGDYYIVVHGYNMNSMRSYLSIQ